MISYMKTTYDSLLAQLTEMSTQQPTLPLRCEAALSCIAQTLHDIREHIRGYVYRSSVEEVHLNRELIPGFFAQYVYYATLYRIETEKPLLSLKSTRKHYRLELHRLEDCYQQHRDFYRYYRSDKHHLDYLYFTRDGREPAALLADMAPLWEDAFCTYYAYLAGVLLAYERVKEHVLQALYEIKLPIRERFFPSAEPSTLLWTASKTDLIEQIYSWHAAGVFNHGKATIKEIVACAEEMFSIKLGNTSMTFQEILRRKEYTLLLDRLKNALLMHVNRIEEKHIR